MTNATNIVTKPKKEIPTPPFKVSLSTHPAPRFWRPRVEGEADRSVPVNSDCRQCGHGDVDAHRLEERTEGAHEVRQIPTLE